MQVGDVSLRVSLPKRLVATKDNKQQYENDTAIFFLLHRFRRVHTHHPNNRSPQSFLTRCVYFCFLPPKVGMIRRCWDLCSYIRALLVVYSPCWLQTLTNGCSPLTSLSCGTFNSFLVQDIRFDRQSS